MRTVLAPSPGCLTIAEAPVPTPGRGGVRIRVQAATVNPVDLALRAGSLIDNGLVVPVGPLALGWDVAGTVDALGPGVDGFQPGDAVIGLRDLLPAPGGTHADFVV